MKPKLLFIAPRINGFIQNDIELLQDHYDLKVSAYSWYKKSLIPINLIRQLFSLLLTLRRYDKLLIHFGGYWSLIPALLGSKFNIPVYIVLHGTDTASIPSLSYGSLRKPLLRFFCKWSYHFAFRLLPVSESLIRIENQFLNEPSPQGVRHYFPKNKTPYTVIHNGLMVDYWASKQTSKKPNSFITVFTMDQFFLKGGDLIIEVAYERPAIDFCIVGITKQQFEKLGLEKPINVEFMGILDKSALRKAYSNHQFHLQLSAFEGFGLALCEAMLGECIPIGSSVNMIPDIIGDTGYIVMKKEKNMLLNSIDNAISASTQNMGKRARERIIDRFSNDKRTEALLKVLAE